MSSILIIDDSQDIQFLFSTLLQMDGQNPHTASSAQQALKLLQEGLRPDLILLDLNLEDISGVDFLNQLESENPEILDSVPVVFITGMDQVPQSRASGFIRKPIENKEFIATVHRYLNQKQAQQL